MTADPLVLFRDAGDALDRADWLAAAALCDPVSLAAFHRQLLEQFDPARAHHVELTVDELLRRTPDMPREVAEFQVAQHRTRTDPVQQLQEELPDVASVAELRAMSAADAFAAWLDGRSLPRQIARLVAAGRISRADAEAAAGSASAVHHHVAIGAVPDGDRIAHVLYRRAVGAEQASIDGGDDDDAPWLARLSPEERELGRELAGRTHPQVATCRRQPDGSWRLLADHDFLGRANVVVGIVEDAGAAPDAHAG